MIYIPHSSEIGCLDGVARSIIMGFHVNVPSLVETPIDPGSEGADMSFCLKIPVEAPQFVFVSIFIQ